MQLQYCVHGNCHHVDSSKVGVLKEGDEVCISGSLQHCRSR